MGDPDALAAARRTQIAVESLLRGHAVCNQSSIMQIEEIKSKVGSASKAIKDTAKSTQQNEGETTRAIDHVTATVPSTVFLAAAGAAMVAAIVLKVAGRTPTANFVGQWVPTILLLGIYTKIVKVAGSDRTEGDGLHA